MINLDKTKDSIWDNYRPEVIAKNTVKHKQNTAHKINDTDFCDVAKYETQDDKKGSTVTNEISNFRTHIFSLRGKQT